MTSKLLGVLILFGICASFVVALKCYNCRSPDENCMRVNKQTVVSECPGQVCYYGNSNWIFLKIFLGYIKIVLALNGTFHIQRGCATTGICSSFNAGNSTNSTISFRCQECNRDRCNTGHNLKINSVTLTIVLGVVLAAWKTF